MHQSHLLYGRTGLVDHMRDMVGAGVPFVAMNHMVYMAATKASVMVEVCQILIYLAIVHSLSSFCFLTLFFWLGSVSGRDVSGMYSSGFSGSYLSRGSDVRFL